MLGGRDIVGDGITGRRRTLAELDGADNLPEDMDEKFDELAEKYGTGAAYKMFSAK